MRHAGCQVTFAKRVVAHVAETIMMASRGSNHHPSVLLGAFVTRRLEECIDIAYDVHMEHIRRGDNAQERYNTEKN